MVLEPFRPRDPGSKYSIANFITIIRLIVSLSFFALAVVRDNPTYNYIGFFFHWLVDFLDGLCARKLKQETILGAEMDIIVDRVEILFFFVNLFHFKPELVPAGTLYLIDYAFVDFYLSFQFNKYGIISPNYFNKVDRTIYFLNYSPVGKFCNSSVPTLMLIFLPGLHPIAGFLACILIGVKVFSVIRLWKIPQSAIPRSRGRSEE
ncbi:CDP-alcohol phosphatidyltransferase family protein [bacterium]|nr:CDP-alcohol phosphatidyltransferase family protein [bacterium]